MFNPQEEKDFKTLIGLGKKLCVPIPEMFLELEVTKDGRVLTRVKQRSHSWNRNAYNLMFSMLAGKNVDDVTFEAGKVSLKDKDGVVVTEDKCAGTSNDVDGTSYGYRAPAANDTYGILVGSGTNAEDFEGFFLQTQIAEGAGAGQLNHVTSEAHAISYGALVLKNTLIRYLNNNSGGNVSVNEVALVFDYLAGGLNYCMLSRDKLGATVTVPDTGQLKVTYEISLTYPS